MNVFNSKLISRIVFCALCLLSINMALAGLQSKTNATSGSLQDCHNGVGKFYTKILSGGYCGGKQTGKDKVVPFWWNTSMSICNTKAAVVKNLAPKNAKCACITAPSYNGTWLIKKSGRWYLDNTDVASSCVPT